MKLRDFYLSRETFWLLDGVLQQQEKPTGILLDQCGKQFLGIECLIPKAFFPESLCDQVCAYTDIAFELLLHCLQRKYTAALLLGDEKCFLFYIQRLIDIQTS